MARPRSALTKFVLSLPRNLSAKEVIARAKSNGLKTSEHNVYRIRGSLGPKLAKTSPTKTAAPTKPAAPVTSNTKPVLSKSDFIRSQPATLSAAEVVTKAKAEGIKFTSQLVYKVRGRSKPKTGTAKRTSKVTNGAASAKPAKSKAAFVRSHSNLSPKEIVAKAKAEGVRFDVRYVYRIRAYDKATRKTKSAAAKPLTSKPAFVNGTRPSVTSPAASSSAEDLLRAIAAELGLGRAVEILAGERARVRAMILG